MRMYGLQGLPMLSQDWSRHCTYNTDGVRPDGPIFAVESSNYQGLKQHEQDACRTEGLQACLLDNNATKTMTYENYGPHLFLDDTKLIG